MCYLIYSLYQSFQEGRERRAKILLFYKLDDIAEYKSVLDDISKIFELT